MGRSQSPAEPATARHYVVLVLGDVGRSPRMQYHTVSLADMPGKSMRCRHRCLACRPDELMCCCGMLCPHLQVLPCH